MQVFRGTRGALGDPVALTIGNFDGVHLGHQAILARVRKMSQKLTLTAGVLTFEPHPREFFSPVAAPARLTTLREKLECLAHHGVDRTHVVRFNHEFAAMSPDDFVAQLLVENLGVRCLLVGDDFRYGAGRGGDYTQLARAAERFGFQLESMESVSVAGERVSSTAVREALARGDFAQAERLLGRPYTMEGRVAHGEKLGRRLGFPTANIPLKRKRAPLTGIYAVKLHGIEVTPLPAVASLGVRPTVLADAAPVLEVHVLDFNADIYGRRVRVEFLHKLRDEEKYPDLETLRRQIQRDVEHARQYLNSDA
jgi:riboflavin kinase / FMN adenylyltransferase